MSARACFIRLCLCMSAMLVIGGGVAGNARAEIPAGMARIAGGTFTMGSNTALADERPPHRVTLATFWLDRRPVTNAEFATFLQHLGRTREPDGRKLFDLDDNDARIRKAGPRYEPFAGQADHPVVEASWYGARAYCAWQGKRLPTEAEWEYAARGTAGRSYPWGDTPPDASRAHYQAGWGKSLAAGALPAGATPEGVRDMAGNVHEWTSSIALPYPYDAGDGREDPDRIADRVTRGGAADTGPETLRATWRGANVSRNPRSGHHNIGFRCASSRQP